MRALRVKRFVQGILFFLVPSFLVQSEGRFFVPTRKTHTLSRAGAVRLAVAPASLQSTDGVRPRLDSCEHVSTLALAGTTITRGARFLRRDETRAASLYPVGRENPYP